MGLTEDEIEARLAELRRQRESLDREIADLVLYLELGRRLSGSGAGWAPGATPAPRSAETVAGPVPAAGPHAATPAARAPAPTRPAANQRAVPAEAPGRAPDPPAVPAASDDGIEADPPPAIAFAEDPSGARRYGRALIEAACAAIAQAGRPLHAGEILEHVLVRGFTLPGRDPVAALNTRLWKRTGPGGPLRRVGEAVYALAAAPEAGGGRTPPDRA